MRKKGRGGDLRWRVKGSLKPNGPSPGVRQLAFRWDAQESLPPDLGRHARRFSLDGATVAGPPATPTPRRPDATTDRPKTSRNGLGVR
ncbi:hypothetical protein MRX96_032690 [Rhipicephalus microplus]